jgi:CHAT domain-containing protein/Tfp pilus assembly protein PilF
MIRIFSIGLIILLSVTQAFSQKEAYKYEYDYNFENSKAEKLFKKARQAYVFDEDYETLLKIEDDLISTFADKGDTVSANVYAWLGDSYYYKLEDVDGYLGFLEKELAIRRSIGVNSALSATLLNLAFTYDELGEYDQSEVYYIEALSIEADISGEKSLEYIESALYLIEHYVYVEDAVKGLEFSKNVLKSLKKAKIVEEKNALSTVEEDYYYEGLLLRFIGDFYQMSGKNDKAIKSVLQAIKIYDENGLNPSKEYGAFLASLGGFYNKTSNLPVAEELFLQAIDMFERLDGFNEEFIAATKTNYGQVLVGLGNYEKAETLYLENLKVVAGIYGADSYFYAVDAANLVNCYLQWGKYSKALEYNEISAGKLKEIIGEESYGYALSLQDKTRILTKTGRTKEAIEVGIKAVEITEKALNNKQETSYATFFLADAYFADGNIEKAEEFHQSALELIETSVGSNHPKYARSTTKMAILNWKKQNIKKALGYYDQTFDNYFKQINTIFPVLSESEKAKFFYNRLKPAFEQYNSFIVETSRDQKELIGKMYNNQLATKGLILYATNKVRDAINKSGDSTIINKYGVWIDQKEQLAKLFSAGDMPVEERNKQIDGLTKSSNEIEKELSIASKEFAATFSNKEYTWEDVRDKLKPGEAAVEIIRFRDFTPDSAGVFTNEIYYAALIVTPESKNYPALVLLRNGQKMETRFLSNYRNAIKYKVKENYSYNLFWKPIVNRLEGIKKVYLSPDGVYNQISLYTLRNPASNNYTIDEMEIQVVTNTKDLVAYEPRDLSDNPSYLFGFPNYNMGELETEEKGEDADNRGMSRGGERGARGARGGAGQKDFDEMAKSGSIPRGLRGNMLRYMRSNSLLAMLPGTKKEVALIDSLYAVKQKPVISYYMNDALEDSIKAMKNPRTLHIATHGFFLESASKNDGNVDNYVENPLLRSGLILAGANSFIKNGRISSEVDYNQDGILTAYEAMNLNLDQTELVVLSACETGLGEIANGEGVYGLQRAFKIAGADAIIMSMWTVDDAATQELMTLFYEEWLGGENKQIAFINAQKRLKDKWKDPYYWGAFIMVGN